MGRKALLSVLWIFLACSPGIAQDWAREMFETTSHDFGWLARGAKAEFEFVLKNPFEEDLHIAGVRSSCGCTRVRIQQPWVKPHGQSAIIASINTQSFRGRKSATITVTFDKPSYAQVQLHSRCYIRSDVAFEPGSVELGTVDQGVPAQRTITVSRSGRGDWRVLEVKCANPHISGEVVETHRDRRRVSYELAVYLDEDAPPGYIQDHLMLVTNDRNTTEIPLLVEGVVQAAITVSPASLFMGVVEPGQRVTKQLVVRGKRPFRILSITSDDRCFQFGTPTDDTPKSLHLIPVTFIAGDVPGKVLKTIRIETDLEETPPELAAYAVVSP